MCHQKSYSQNFVVSTQADNHRDYHHSSDIRIKRPRKISNPFKVNISSFILLVTIDPSCPNSIVGTTSSYLWFGIIVIGTYYYHCIPSIYGCPSTHYYPSITEFSPPVSSEKLCHRSRSNMLYMYVRIPSVRPKNQESRLQTFCLVPSAHGYMSHASIGLVRKTWSLASERFCPVPSAHGYMSHASIGFVRKTWSLASKMFFSVPSVHGHMSHASIGLVRKTWSFASIMFCTESRLRRSCSVMVNGVSPPLTYPELIITAHVLLLYV